jgi:hypothetical protein
MSGKIYKNQDYLRIKIYIGYTLSGATALIKYRDPNGTEGSWAVTVENELNGVVYKDFGLGSTLGVSGIWTFWGHVTFADGRTAPCESFTEMIYDEGS